MRRQLLISVLIFSTFMVSNGQWSGTNPIWTYSNVGIGTASPIKRLEVNTVHAANIDDEIRIGSYYNSNFYGLGLNYQIDGIGTPTKHIVEYNGTRSIVMTLAGGNVGIGNTAPQGKLQINQTSSSVATRWGYAPDDTNYHLDITPVDTWASSVYWKLNTTGGALVLNTDGGNVGIGTTAPTLKFEVDNTTTGEQCSIGFTPDAVANVTNISGKWYGNVVQAIKYHRGGNSTGGSMSFWTTPDNGSLTERIRIDGWGNVGIGTTNPGNYKLNVYGSIHANEVVVNTMGADYVFNPDYKLLTLYEVESFIKVNNHLPDMVSATEMKEKGMNVSEMQTILLQKIEELTLYAIEQNKKNEDQSKDIELMKKEIALLKGQNK